MRPKRFDDGYFISVAEGNLPMGPNQHLQVTTPRQGGDASWVTARTTRTSLMANRRFGQSVSDPTLNSFAAFGDDPGPVYGPPTPAGVGVQQPIVAGGNFWTNTVSGVLQAITPAASAAVKPQPSTKPATTQQQLMQQYLQGKLPGATINQQGQVVPKSEVPWVPIAIGVGVLALGAVLLGTRRSRK